uniref:RNA-binding S4 domain-containing protein n=1 Tax=Gopherus evgoodei TaxID=1825980 RepID=A0A8C4VPF5_9SAUR
MARGPKKHLKRVAAPKHWMLDKLTGVFAPHPSTGPHKLRECLPLIIFLRNRLKYVLTGDEVKKICMQRFIKIDGKVRTDITYPAGFMDVISIEKTGEHFRLVYDTKGRFAVHRITAEETKYKCELCSVPGLVPAVLIYKLDQSGFIRMWLLQYPKSIALIDHTEKYLCSWAVHDTRDIMYLALGLIATVSDSEKRNRTLAFPGQRRCDMLYFRKHNFDYLKVLWEKVSRTNIPSYPGDGETALSCWLPPPRPVLSTGTSSGEVGESGKRAEQYSHQSALSAKSLMHIRISAY